MRNWRQKASACVALTLAALTGSAMAAQPATSTSDHLGLVQDWSTSHNVYTRVLTLQEAKQRGANATKQWLLNARDPRFMAALRRRLNAQASAQAMALQTKNHPQWWSPPHAKSTITRDWSNVIGGGTNGLGGAGSLGDFPAKYSFNINATASCANDFVVYTTAAAGATQSTGTPTGETYVGTFTTTTTGSIILNAPTVSSARTVTLTASATLNTGLNFQSSATVATEATNLANAVNRYSGQTGIVATTSAGKVTLTYNTVGGTSTTNVTSTLTNFGTLTRTSGTGTPGQPTLVAFNNIYAGTCTGTVPSVFWSYNTTAASSTAITETSPVLSYYDDGAQVAFVQRNTTPTPDVLQLVLLKWSSASPGTAAAPTAPTSVAAASYRGCTAPCMTVLTFTTSTGDAGSIASLSSPYVDYVGDVLWVGDNNGYLHKFTGVFSGTPAEAGSPFPVHVDTGSNVLYSPVYDATSGMVFIGSDTDATNGGQFYRVNASTGAVVATAALSALSSTGISTDPIVDSSAQKVYTGVFDDNTTTGDCNVTGAAAPCHRLLQFPTNFVAGANGTSGGTSGSSVEVGHGNVGLASDILYEGTFDNAYLTTGAGNMYICGSTAGTTSEKALWKVPISSANVMGTPVEGAQITGDDGTNGNICSPVTESINGTHEYLYVSTPKEGEYAGTGTCTITTTDTTLGCLYMFDLTNLSGTAAAWGTGNTPNASLSLFGGTGGIIIDNVSISAGASQVYFSNNTAPGNAYQASQSLLQ